MTGARKGEDKGQSGALTKCSREQEGEGKGMPAISPLSSLLDPLVDVIIPMGDS